MIVRDAAHTDQVNPINKIRPMKSEPRLIGAIALHATSGFNCVEIFYKVCMCFACFWHKYLI